ncbi:helix-turn-helix transcriptional regulator [Dysgonomonas sp. 25]|uniref:helix-turn-helix transcriptional regulator n=1 Tax=Dysgonomonas sp. 25 TaxID=2302933 RepID=UPI0013D83E7F|nr:helix-turn-helix transcriptional regulator [Dysgonomonas sp. 25]NDV67861.1 AraC family transcriptional regulator [Dysgonomonas sp. 25]
MTKLLYVEEHCTCFNYEHVGSGSIEVMKLAKDTLLHVIAKHHKILFIRKGSISYTLDNSDQNMLTAGKMTLIPSDTNFHGQALEDIESIIIRIPVEEQLCDTYSFENLLHEEKENESQPPKEYVLPINDKVDKFLSFMQECTEDGLRCAYYFQIKQKELFFLLRAYYHKEDLYNFFYPLLTSDISFSQFMIRNRNKVKTVKELAKLSNYSLSGFQKRFKKVFGISAHQWLNEQRSKSILHDINNSAKALKEISRSYGFSSQSYFNDFCKMNFGTTPGQLRRKKNGQEAVTD